MKRIEKLKTMNTQEVSECISGYVAGILFDVAERLGVGFSEQEKEEYVKELTKQHCIFFNQECD